MKNKDEEFYYIDIGCGKINDISEIYKGDGITTCKWCGDTGWMHTFSNDGYFYSDAPCICALGQMVLKEKRNELHE